MAHRLGLLALVGWLLGSLALSAREAPAAAPPARAPRLDLRGDPLPPAARARLGSLRLYAGASVRQLLFSQDGKVLFSLADSLLAWDAATGKELRLLEEAP